ncbi:MAG: sigma-54 interaction domain-containing protein [Thermodesulfobacteriota bacterium]
MHKQQYCIWSDRFAERLLDSMAEGVFTLDTRGVITSWNPAMERVSGYTADEAVGQSCQLLKFSRCFDRTCPSNISECGVFKKGTVDPTECQLQHRSGGFVSVIKNARVVTDDNGDVLGVVETITDLTELTQARQKVEEAQRKLVEVYQFGNIIGKSHAIQEIFNAIRVAAKSDATVLIQGESGTGKELVASAIHYNSERHKGSMVTVNCSALTESLLESELFGHVRGAFTGAHKDRMGRFEEADTGSIFLDEIGDISPFIQLKLLRAIQEKQIERVGESRKRNVDIRIITATLNDLYGLVQSGHFREDLYYRLKVFPIYLPPLRNRREDIPLLARYFIQKFNEKTGKLIQTLSPDAMRILMDYNWPGNVRELENAIEHAFVLVNGDQIGIFDLPVEIRQMEYYAARPPEPSNSRPTRPKQKVTRALLVELLQECAWNKAEVARRLGRSRTSVWKYMKKWGIPLNEPESSG